MELLSVRLQIQHKWMNYEPFCKVLCHIDKSCREQIMDFSFYTVTAEDVLILNGLTSMDVSTPNYIKNSFNLFKNSTQNFPSI